MATAGDATATVTVLTIFHPFPKLSTELRLQIWELSVIPRIVRLEAQSGGAPAGMHINKESRAVFAKHYNWYKTKSMGEFCICLSIDTVHLPTWGKKQYIRNCGAANLALHWMAHRDSVLPTQLYKGLWENWFAGVKYLMVDEDLSPYLEHVNSSCFGHHLTWMLALHESYNRESSVMLEEVSILDKGLNRSDVPLDELEVVASLVPRDEESTCATFDARSFHKAFLGLVASMDGKARNEAKGAGVHVRDLNMAKYRFTLLKRKYLLFS